jgi:hypothetical protein
MTRTQIQLPEALYERAKRFAAEHELSLAEITRRGLELFLQRYPQVPPPRHQWQLPRVRGGGIKLPLEQLHSVMADVESARSLGRK